MQLQLDSISFERYSIVTRTEYVLTTNKRPHHWPMRRNTKRKSQRRERSDEAEIKE